MFVKSFTPGLIQKVKLGVLVFIPAVLFFIPLHSLDALPSICLIKYLTGHECPGCGMTHACLNLIQGHFSDAFNYNKLVIVIFPLLSYIWLKKVLFEYKKLKTKS